MTKKFDPVLIAVLIHREHSRLSSQVKTLQKLLHAPFSEVDSTLKCNTPYRLHEHLMRHWDLYVSTGTEAN